MYWYAIYRHPEKFGQGGFPSAGIYGPYDDDRKAWYKLSIIQDKNPEVTPWDVYGTFTSNPEEALLEFLQQRQFEYVGGMRGG